jgi:hypothetical protein
MMELMREKWSDERLDDLSARVDDLGRRMDLRFDSVDRRFERIDERLDTMTRVMTQGFVATGAAMATGFVTLAGLIVGLH